MRKIIFTEEQLDKLKEMISSNQTQATIAEYFGTTDTLIRKICRENNIELKRALHTYQCCVCGKEFQACYKSAICTECKNTPSVCIVCGKEFEKTSPYTQKTCSKKCRGIYRKNSGIAQSIGQKMIETKMERYGTVSPAKVAKLHKGQFSKKICKICGEEFIPDTPNQVYCKKLHYGACPICGKPVEIRDVTTGPQTCSEECRMMKINNTCLEKYGSAYAINSEHAKELSKQTTLEKYGKEFYSQTIEYKEKVKATSLERYGTEHPMQNKSIQAKSKQTNLKKYGKESYMQTQEGKDQVKATQIERYGGIGLASSVIRNKIIETNMQKHGYQFPFESKEVQLDIKNSNLEKYGTEWAATTEEANKKRAATNLERYGAENVFGSKEIQEKSKATCLEKYGVENAMYNPELAKISSERQQQSMIAKYGVNASVLVPSIRKKMESTSIERYGVPFYGMSEEFAKNTISKTNEKFAADLGHLGILTTFEFKIDTRRYDLKIINSNTVIEIDPTYTHNTEYSPYGNPHDANYHLMKTKLAESNGYRCIHIFDWDDHVSMINLLKTRKKIFARKCSISRIDRRTAEIFTAKYHIQGSCRGQNIVYGLFYQGDLVQLMSFGKPRYNKNFDFELLRLCTQVGIEVVGGPSRLFTAFLRDNPGKSILSYCDYAKFLGDVYSSIGMKLSHTTSPAKVWSKGAQHITDNYLRQHGFDRIFNANFGKGTSNEELMLKHGWLPVYDCGQKVFVFEPDK